jgi:hypothetical protein
MVSHMKTTVEIADPVLAEAKEAARREKTTLRSLVEEGLRLALDRRHEAAPFHLLDVSVGGNGLKPGAKGASWDELLVRAYEGHGA